VTPTDPPPLVILHRDDWVVAVSKPGGMIVHRSRESADRVFLLQTLRGQLGRRLYPVHRLDRAASGVLALAFCPDGARRLQASLAAEDAIKEYLVLVRGETPETGETHRPLTGENGSRKPAHTCFERILLLGRFSLLTVRITTGRRHQIRRHLAHLRHQVIGDTTYGKGNINRHLRSAYGLPRLFLHARLLDVPHPGGEGRLRVEAPLAADLREFLLRLPDVDPGLVERL
jgi:tRNA pseudouridine65 synthase